MFLYVINTKGISRQYIHLGLTKSISYSNINELVFVCFFKIKCNDALIMITQVGMSIDDITYIFYLLIIISRLNVT
jgi:hypothetical protein